MNRSISIVALAVAAFMLVAPLAAAQGHSQYGTTAGDPRFAADGEKCRTAVAGTTDASCIVLYAHIFDLLNDAPMNVQRIPDEFRDHSRGLASGVIPHEAMFNFNHFKLYSSPGFVEYDLANLDQKPRLHPEKGLAGDIEFGSIPIYGYWYLSADADETPFFDQVPPGGDDPSVGALPCITVAMYIQTGRFWGVDGDVITQGKTTKTIVTGAPLAGTDNPGVPDHPCASGDSSTVTLGDVVEFEIEMPPPTDPILQNQGYMVYVEWWLHAPGNQQAQDKVYHHQWNMHTGDPYLNRIVIPVQDPLFIQRVKPQFFDGKIYVQGSLNSPWGSYDVDPMSIVLDVLDESGQPVTANMEPPVLRYSVDHDGHFKPVNATFVWEYQKDNIAPGTYTVRLSATNWQHTYTVSKEASITISEDISKSVAIDSDGGTQVGDSARGVDNTEESPAFGVTPLVLLGMLLLAFVGWKRRQ